MSIETLFRLINDGTSRQDKKNRCHSNVISVILIQKKDYQNGKLIWFGQMFGKNLGEKIVSNKLFFFADVTLVFFFDL